VAYRSPHKRGVTRRDATHLHSEITGYQQRLLLARSLGYFPTDKLGVSPQINLKTTPAPGHNRAMAAPPTILSHKATFLNAQTLQLSQQLAPSGAWRASSAATAAASDSAPLPERVIDDAIHRLNQTLQQHARRVYAPQATRHVAEQIEALFLDAGSAQTDRDADGEEIGDGGGVLPGELGALRLGTDFGMLPQ
jgi:hypothetical protein